MKTSGLWTSLCIALQLGAGCANHDDRKNSDAIKHETTAKQKIDGVLITSLSSPPGWTVAEQKGGGFYCQFFQYSGTGDYSTRFDGALAALVAEGKRLGANAFVHTTVSSESHEIQGSKWHASFVHICGDFVALK